ncbi:rod-binding protein [Microvirga pakistanensis]|uniref:rod-binding protein n=1 Tax=Microvirga pakistanensis TaxID=1682650 RepID=UPI00141B380C|nr:rod-binding protein [Microvirga pakistanensis]
MSARPIGVGADIYQIRNSMRNDAESAAAAKSKKTAQELEAFILQTFVESMLPKEAENTYGEGSAGSIWKTMMAEQIGAQVARSGGIGLAKYILGEKK